MRATRPRCGGAGLTRLRTGTTVCRTAVATLVVTRAARPSHAIVLATTFNLLGPLLVGAAVANTIGGIVNVSPSAVSRVIGSGLAAAVAWKLLA